MKPMAGLVLPVFAAGLFLGAFLLFWVQPLFAKMVLPMLGGAPAVWNTAMVFFQIVLLAGYGYAHALDRLARPGAQLGLHASLLALGLAALPIVPPVAPPQWGAEGAPVSWLLGQLALGVGVPFFALSATAPLLQAWYARSGAARGQDPYFLYAASNLGSLLALLAFPFLLEPGLRLAEQAGLWRLGYAVLLGLVVFCGWRAVAGGRVVAGAAAEPIDYRQCAVWVALAALPSSLLLGVTTHISTDIAAAPLLWVVPLALYLLTYVLAFAQIGAGLGARLAKPQAAALVGVAVLLLAAAALRVGSLAAQILLHLGAFFLTALVCHAELARRRPALGGLTLFYLCMSLGGAVGGMFNALAAPVLFSGAYEYEIALVLACAARVLLPGFSPRVTRWDGLAPGLLFLFVGGFAWVWQNPGEIGLLGRAVLLLPVALALYGFSPRPARFALGLAGVLAATPLVRGATELAHQERSFFGVHRVVRAEGGGRMELFHGQTLHGAQFRDAARRTTPLGYYSRTGPAGQVFAAFPAARRVGVVGLGAGAQACLTRPGQEVTFFEIDPVVARIARDARWFSYLADCAPAARVVIADGRLALAARMEERFDILVVDAFSSDSIPLHLLTREAMALYLQRLAPGGVLLLHVSNLYLDLPPVVTAAVAGLGAGLVQLYAPDAAAQAEGAGASHWAVIAADAAVLAPLAADGRWQVLRAAPGSRAWTDDFSDLVGALAR